MNHRPSDTSNQKRRSTIQSSFRHSSAIDSAERGTYTEGESQYTYTYTNGKETNRTGATYSRVEQEYLEFLKQYGHIDFSLIDFLPEIKSIDELKQIRRRKGLEDNSARKYHDLTKKSDNRGSHELTVINEECEDYTETGKSNNLDDEEARQVQGEVIKANRFDFCLNDQYYVSNIKIDPNGERIETKSDLQGRVVAKQCIYAAEEDEEEEGKDNSSKKKQSPFTEKMQRGKFYFQYRIDELEEGLFNPKICIGVCKEDFMVNQDLSR